MIKVTRLNDSEFVVNADFISFVEATPDTVIRLTTGERVLVKESVNEVIEKVIAYSRECGSRPLFRPGVPVDS